MRSVGSQPAKLYGLPKVHKDGIPMRPVISMINTSQYRIAKYLDSKLKPLLSSEFTCRDSFEFVEVISNLDVNNNFMVSFDIVNLFTNVPLHETIDLCCKLWRNNVNEHHLVDEIAFRELLYFATSNLRFLFNNDWYQQVDGVAMGSPLAPTLASIFLSKIEEKISLYDGIKPKIYKRYVDDIFLLFDNKEQVEPFLNYMNSLHSNIKFTVEYENNNVLPFLDLLIERVKNNHFETGIYRKKTDTGLYTTPNSFCEPKYKRNMIKGLIYRSWTLSSTYAKCNESIDKLMNLLHKNGYSKSIVEKLTRETVDKLIKSENEKSNTINSDKNKNKNEINNYRDNIGFVLTVPYSEGFRKFKNSILKHDENNLLNLKIVSRSCKIGSLFSSKSITPTGLCSNLVYQYKCNGCDAIYIGETCRHLCKRIQEHNRRESDSNIAQHKKNCSNSKVDVSNFKILCSQFDNYWERVMCEALLIKSFDPKINVQTPSSSTLLKVFS